MTYKSFSELKNYVVKDVNAINKEMLNKLNPCNSEEYRMIKEIAKYIKENLNKKCKINIVMKEEQKNNIIKIGESLIIIN